MDHDEVPQEEPEMDHEELAQEEEEVVEEEDEVVVVRMIRSSHSLDAASC